MLASRVISRRRDLAGKIETRELYGTGKM